MIINNFLNLLNKIIKYFRDFKNLNLKENENNKTKVEAWLFNEDGWAVYKSGYLRVYDARGPMMLTGYNTVGWHSKGFPFYKEIRDLGKIVEAGNHKWIIEKMSPGWYGYKLLSKATEYDLSYIKDGNN
jgi:hypothetical protein